MSFVRPSRWVFWCFQCALRLHHIKLTRSKRPEEKKPHSRLSSWCLGWLSACFASPSLRPLLHFPKTTQNNNHNHYNSRLEETRRKQQETKAYAAPHSTAQHTALALGLVTPLLPSFWDRATHSLACCWCLCGRRSSAVESGGGGSRPEAVGGPPGSVRGRPLVPSRGGRCATCSALHSDIAESVIHTLVSPPASPPASRDIHNTRCTRGKQSNTATSPNADSRGPTFGAAVT